MRSLLLSSALALPITALLTMAPPLASDTADLLGLDGLAQDLSGVGTAEATLIRRAKIKKKRTLGYRVVVVVDDDPENAVDNVSVTLPFVPGQPTPSGGTNTCDDAGNCSTTVTATLKVTKPNGRKRFVFNQLDFDGEAVDQAYSLEATLKDAAGADLGPAFVKTVEVNGAGDTRVRSLTIRQLDDVNFRLKALVVGDFADEVNEVHACVDDYSGPDPEPDDCFVLSDPAINGGKKTFELDTLTFSDPTLAADEVYSMVASLVRDDGSVVGVAEFDTVVEGLPADEVTLATDLLADLATAELLDAGSQLGVDVVPTSISYTVSPSGSFAWYSGTWQGAGLIANGGFTSMTAGGLTIDLVDVDYLLVSSVDNGGASTHFVDTYSATTGLVGTWSWDDEHSLDTSSIEPGGAGVVGGSTPTGVVLYRTEQFGGDILIGGMSLEDFND